MIAFVQEFVQTYHEEFDSDLPIFSLIFLDRDWLYHLKLRYILLITTTHFNGISTLGFHRPICHANDESFMRIRLLQQLLVKKDKEEHLFVRMGP